MIAIAQLTDVERKFVETLRRRAKAVADWNEFENDWTQADADFYKDT